MTADLVRVRFVASRRGTDFRYIHGQTVAIAPELAAQFIREGAAVPFEEPKAPPPRKKAKEADPVFSGDGADQAGVQPGRVFKIADAKPLK
jgi:hypothetical protein